MSEQPVYPSPQNRRLARRQEPRGTTTVRCIPNAHGLGKNVALRLLDLSESGARLLLHENVACGQESEVTLECVSLTRPLVRLAKVVWTTSEVPGQIRVGLAFQQPLTYSDWQAMVRM